MTQGIPGRLALLCVVLVPPPLAIPSPLTLYKRVLQSDVIAIVRLAKADQPADWSSLGDCYRVTVREVLLDRAPDRPLAGFDRLDNLIPGSSMIGHKHPVAEDVDVLLFGRRSSPHGKAPARLVLLSFCLNSVVPLQGRLDEYVGRQFRKSKLTAAGFLAATRRVVGEFHRFPLLRREFEQALGSRHPFCAADKAGLLRLLLALPDPQVPAFAETLREVDLPAASRAVLAQYFVRKGRLEPLRDTFDQVLQRYRDGELTGTEVFRFPNGSLNPRRPRCERLLDAAAVLVEASDGAYLAQHLLPLVRAGDLFVAAPLLRAGNGEALTRTLATRPVGLPAVQTLLRSGERAAVLAAIRLALAADPADRRQELLAAVRKATRRWRPPAGDAAAEWRVFWSRTAARFPAVFPRGVVDQHLGTVAGFGDGGKPRDG